MNILDEITEKDVAFLNEEYQQLIMIVGLETFKKLVLEHNGCMIYIPKKRSVEISLRNKKILAEFNGSNYKELAQKYELTEIWIRHIVSGKAN